MIRDEEIKRLEMYSESLGLPVVWKQYVPYSKSHGAAVIIENDVPVRLEMVTWKRKSKTQIVLDFIHELAHHMSWIYKGRKDSPELLEAMYATNPNKNQRKLVYEMEKEDSNYRLLIYRELGIKIEEWKLLLDIAVDIWYYKHWWLTGKQPSIKQTRKTKRGMKVNYAT